MGIETIQPGATQTDQRRYPGVVDVSDVKTSEVTEFAGEREVFFERRGGRTYLITA